MAANFFFRRKTSEPSGTAKCNLAYEAYWMFTPSRFNAPSQEIETSLTSPLPGCKIEQSCFLRSKYYSEIYGEFFGSLLPLEPTSMTTVEHRRDKDMVPILVEIVIKKLTIKPKKLTNLGRGNQLTGDEVALSTTSHPNFFRPCYIYSCSDWSRARLFAKVID